MPLLAGLVAVALAQAPAPPNPSDPGPAPSGAPGATSAPSVSPAMAFSPGGAAPSAGALPRLLVVRATVGTARAVRVTVTDSKGERSTLTLADDGRDPDRRAGDGEYAGLMRLEDHQAAAALEVDGRLGQADPVRWEPGEERRVLALTWKDGKVEAAAQVGQGFGAPVNPMAGMPAAGTLATVPRAPVAAPAAISAGPGRRAVFWGAIAVAAVSALGAGAVLLSRRGSPSLPVALRPVDPRGALGPGTPSVSAAVQAWLVSPADRLLLVHALAEALAPYHPVVLALPDTEALAPLPGAGVFRSAAPRPEVARAARSLTSAVRPTVVVAAPLDAAGVAAWRAPIPGCRVVVLVTDPQEAHDAVLSRVPGGWRA